MRTLTTLGAIAILLCIFGFSNDSKATGDFQPLQNVEVKTSFVHEIFKAEDGHEYLIVQTVNSSGQYVGSSAGASVIHSHGCKACAKSSD